MEATIAANPLHELVAADCRQAFVVSFTELGMYRKRQDWGQVIAAAVRMAEAEFSCLVFGVPLPFISWNLDLPPNRAILPALVFGALHQRRAFLDAGERRSYANCRAALGIPND